MPKHPDNKPNRYDVSSDPIVIADKILLNEQINSPTEIEEELAKITDEKVRKLARLFVYSMPRAENVFIANRHRQNIDKDVRFNHALKSIIKDGLPIKTDSLLQILVGFIKARQVTTANGHKKGLNETELDKLHTAFSGDFIGMFYEQNFENFMQCSSVECIDANVSQDRHGNDCFLPLDENWYCGIDVTKKVEGIEGKQGKRNNQTIIQTVYPYEYPGVSSPKHPTMSISHMYGHVVVAMDFGLGDNLPEYVGAFRPESFDPDTSKQFYSELTDYVLLEDSVTKYYKEYGRDGSFRLIEESLARTIGRRAS